MFVDLDDMYDTVEYSYCRAIAKLIVYGASVMSARAGPGAQGLAAGLDATGVVPGQRDSVALGVTVGQAGHDVDVLVAPGRRQVILAVGSLERVERVAAEDPLVVAGMAAYEIVTVDPARPHDRLAELLLTAETDNDVWTHAPFTGCALARARYCGKVAP